MSNFSHENKSHFREVSKIVFPHLFQQFYFLLVISLVTLFFCMFQPIIAFFSRKASTVFILHFFWKHSGLKTIIRNVKLKLCLHSSEEGQYRLKHKKKELTTNICRFFPRRNPKFKWTMFYSFSRSPLGKSGKDRWNLLKILLLPVNY